MAAAKATSTARGNGCSIGLVYGLIAACIVLLICVIVAIIIIIRMKGKIKYLQTINYSTHAGEVVQEFEMKTDDGLYDDLHDKKGNANEYRDLHQKKTRNKDPSYKQPPKLPERVNPMDVIISPNSLVESLEAEFKGIHQKYKVQGSNDDDTKDYPNLDALPETEELKTPIDDLKSSAKTVKFDNSVTFYRNESEDINNEDVCEEKETESTEKVEKEFTKQADKIVTDDVDLPSYDDADVGEPGLYDEHDTEKLLQKGKKVIKMVLMEDEYDDQEDDLYESYDDFNGNNNGRDRHKTKIPKKALNNKGNDNPAYDDDEIIDEFGYDESQTAEIDHNNTKRRDKRSNNAKPLQQNITSYDEDLYLVPVSSNFRDSGLPVPPAVPKRKGGVAPKLSVSPNEDKIDINMKEVMEKNKTNTDFSENSSGNVLRNVGEDKFGSDFHDVPSNQPKPVPRRSHGLPFDQNQMNHLTISRDLSSEA
ncbi:hypothetical protein ACJMK2_042563 [Sinanodonta woodiana]|uniref:Uncharacterized protein n=1 Tax=Sinanodonta woodiana TaxID=1069815 RepID=A0ABD3W9M1_SINWO